MSGPESAMAATPQMGSTPIPDPTKLTTDAVSALERQIRRELDFRASLVEARLDGMDTAITLAAENVERGVAEAGHEITLLRDDYTRRSGAEREFMLSQLENVRQVTLAKFEAVDGRFAESKVAVDAAFAAAKEAVGEQNKTNDRAITKSEAATKETISSLGQVTGASIKALEDKFADLKARFDSGEGKTSGVSVTEQTRAAQLRATVAIIVAAVLGLATITLGIIAAIKK